jgi:hypothetical protein
MALNPSLVAAVNRLTARWVAAHDGAATVASGVCAWPLLALLAGAADGAARDELSTATGVAAGTANDDARAVLEALAGADGVAAALGLWIRDDVPVRQRWLAGLPDGVHGRLTGDPGADRPGLDAWAAEHTAGQVPRMPVAVDKDTVLLLATALAVETTWQRRFEDARARWAGDGPHRDAPVRVVRRTDTDLSHVYLARDVTGARVAGSTGIDVHVLLGAPQATAAQVLSTGVAAATGAVPVTEVSRLDDGTPGPGLRVATVERPSPQDSCTMTVPRFTVRASHDLLALPGVFGLAAASDRHRGHLPGISDLPLAVQQARQDAVATFTAVGFRAAAVTAVSVMVGAAMPLRRHRVRQVSFDVDRPFGFVAVHRPTGLVLVTGWVTEPEPAADPWAGAAAHGGGG